MLRAATTQPIDVGDDVKKVTEKDTGASISTVSESEARRLGLAVRELHGYGIGYTGICGWAGFYRQVRWRGVAACGQDDEDRDPDQGEGGLPQPADDVGPHRPPPRGQPMSCCWRALRLNRHRRERAAPALAIQ